LCALGQVALAADLPVRKAPPAPVYVPYNWNGWYVGAHVGYGWGDKDWSDPIFLTPLGTFNHDFNGWLGGFQLGWNYQTGNWLWGIEGDWAWTGIDGTGTDVTAFGFKADMDWLATLTARVGITNDRWLWYIKGGGAWAKETFSVSLPAGFSASETRSGWTVGLGVEYAWGGNWTSKLEYNYIDFRDRNIAFDIPTTANIDQKVHIVKVGLNYKFDWGKAPAAVPARY
jgi:outer membrane immunogenic protein